MTLSWLRKTSTMDARRTGCDDPKCPADTHSDELAIGGEWKLRLVVRHADGSALVQLWRFTEVVGDVTGLAVARGDA